MSGAGRLICKRTGPGGVEPPANLGHDPQAGRSDGARLRVSRMSNWVGANGKTVVPECFANFQHSAAACPASGKSHVPKRHQIHSGRFTVGAGLRPDDMARADIPT